jgi:hypothetical protein
LAQFLIEGEHKAWRRRDKVTAPGIGIGSTGIKRPARG